VTKLDDALAAVTRLACDTAPIIYFVEAHPRYDPLVINVFQRIADGAIAGVTSVITLTEVLIQPLRQSNAVLQQEYRELLLHSANFQMLSITPEIAERGAELRARHSLRTPDALQVATGLVAGCEAFLTNDRGLQRVTELRVLVLDDLKL
jgi:predicted nucleic acid-binding protein